MSSQKVNPWDVPVILALDRIEQLAGFAPDHVQWDYFRFSADGLHGPMDTAFIYALPVHPRTSDDRLVRFCFSTRNRPGYRAGFNVTNIKTPPMSTAELVHTLDVPLRSAVQAKELLHYALQTALEEYNIGHPARRCPTVSDTFSTSPSARAQSQGGPRL